LIGAVSRLGPDGDAHSCVGYRAKDAISGSMVIGYLGKPIFFEPMISKAMLMRVQSFT
jgi:hypothetical protein